MKMNNRDIQIIDKIIDYCKNIQEIDSRFGNNFELFCNDIAYKHSCTMCILQIGELSNALSEEIKNKNAQIQWKSIRGMRNILAHNYGQIDMEIIWQIIQNDIPVLKKVCEEIVENK